MKVRDVELLVGSMQIVVRQSEAHHHAGNLQHILKISDDRNRAPRADEDRVLLERVMQRLGCRFDVFVVRANHARQTFAPHFYFRVDAPGRVLLYEGQVFLENVVRILVGNKPHRDLGFRLCGNDSLRAISNKASRHAMNFQRRSRPSAIQD